MKILWHSNAPWAPTGYGQQTALFAPRLRDLGHDIALSALWGLGGAGIEWNGMRVFPADDEWGNRLLSGFAADHGDGDECLVISLIDVWPMGPEKMPPRMASWCPVDHEPIPPGVRNFFARSSSRPIAMSRFGEGQLRDAGFDPLYVPHGYDSSVFYPRTDEQRRKIREDAGIPADAFVIGMVAANKGALVSRKAFPQVFQAFARLREKHRDAFLYIHANAFPRDGINLRQLALACDIPLETVRFTDPLNLEIGVSPESLADLQSCLDVLANPSFGEGFGIPIIEAQACGTPVIVTDWSAMPEICGAGWKVGGERWYDSPQDSWFCCPSVDELAAALEDAYDEAGGLRDPAAEFAKAYDVDHVTEIYWKPALAELEEPSMREVPPLREAVAA